MKDTGNGAFSQIRAILLEHNKPGSEQGFHVASNLSWHRYEKLLEGVLGLLPRQGRVLDVGCGWGHTTAMLAAGRPGLQITGVDIAPSENWKKLESYGARFLVADALQLPFDDQFDMVVSFGTMEHTGDSAGFLREMARVTRPGGSLLIYYLPNWFALSEAAARLLGIWHHENTYRLSEVRRLFTQAGFEAVSIKREFVIPAQVDRVSQKMGSLFNRHYRGLHRWDSRLTRTPLAFFAENWAICARKP